MSFKNLVILSSSFLIFAAVPPARAAQLTQEKNNRQIQQDRTNDANRKQWSNQTISKDTVRQVQTSLKEHGFDPGPIDGVMGPKTMMALRNFQSGQGLRSSGMIDEPTMNALEINSQSRQQANQMPQAVPRTEQAPGNIGVGPTAFDLEDVRQAQMALRNRGFDPGEMNGMISSQTQQAIREFQRAHNIPVTGRLDQQTQAALGISTKGTDQEPRRTKPSGPSAESEPEGQSR